MQFALVVRQEGRSNNNALQHNLSTVEHIQLSSTQESKRQPGGTVTVAAAACIIMMIILYES